MGEFLSLYQWNHALLPAVCNSYKQQHPLRRVLCHHNTVLNHNCSSLRSFVSPAYSPTHLTSDLSICPAAHSHHSVTTHTALKQFLKRFLIHRFFTQIWPPLLCSVSHYLKLHAPAHAELICQHSSGVKSCLPALSLICGTIVCTMNVLPLSVA